MVVFAGPPSGLVVHPAAATWPSCTGPSTFAARPAATWPSRAGPSTSDEDFDLSAKVHRIEGQPVNNGRECGPAPGRGCASDCFDMAKLHRIVHFRRTTCCDMAKLRRAVHFRRTTCCDMAKLAGPSTSDEDFDLSVNANSIEG